MDRRPDISDATRVIARAATLSADECRRLSEAVQRVELGTYAERQTRFVWFEPFIGPFTEARRSAEESLDRGIRAEVGRRVRDALRAASAGRVGAPGDPSDSLVTWRRNLLGGTGLVSLGIGSVALAIGLTGAVAAPVVRVLGVSLLATIALTVWSAARPARAPVVISAIEAAAYAEILRGVLPDSAIDLLSGPWSEAVERPRPPGGRARMDRVAVWLGTAGLTGFALSLALGVLERSAGLLLWLSVGGLVLIFVAAVMGTVAGLAGRRGARAAAGVPGRGWRVNVAVAAGFSVFLAGVAGAADSPVPVPVWTFVAMVAGIGLVIGVLARSGAQARQAASTRTALPPLGGPEHSISKQEGPRRQGSASEVRWFGPFGDEAIAENPSQLSSAIGDFIRDYRLAHNYDLMIEPISRRMFAVTLESWPAPGKAIAARIPVGSAARRSVLAEVGWAIARPSSSTPYYTKRFMETNVAPQDIATAIVDAYQSVYGDRARQLRWQLRVLPLEPRRVNRVAETGNAAEAPSRIRAARRPDDVE